jgi:hypothetical protein
MCIEGRGARASRPFFIWGEIQVGILVERAVVGRQRAASEGGPYKSDVRMG